VRYRLEGVKTFYALLVMLSVAVVGCTSNDQKEPERLPRGNELPGGGTMAQSPKNYEPTTTDLSKEVDLPIYPGAKVTAQEQAVSGNIPPDERRYRRTLETPDALDKVTAYYKKALDSKAMTTANTANIFARSARGNDYKIVISKEGAVTRVVETIIIYKH
jgi:hypothetical protein